jgi:hypothetical protein
MLARGGRTEFQMLTRGGTTEVQMLARDGMRGFQASTWWHERIYKLACGIRMGFLNANMMWLDRNSNAST